MFRKRHRTSRPKRFNKFTLFGGYRTATLRSFGHAGCNLLLSVCNIGSTRYSVARWEILLASALHVLFKTHQEKQWAYYEKLCAVPKPDGAPRGISWNMTRIRADATISSVKETSKEHIVEIATGFNWTYADEVPDAEPPEVWSSKIWPDTLRVPESCGGVEMRALILAQLDQASCRTWINQTTYDRRSSLHAHVCVFHMHRWRPRSANMPKAHDGRHRGRHVDSGMEMVVFSAHWSSHNFHFATIHSVLFQIAILPFPFIFLSCFTPPHIDSIQRDLLHSRHPLPPSSFHILQRVAATSCLP